ncbi:tRNA threonylcarbamoyladenosine biosynthesis protein TsaB [Bifidobacterium sp. DSM 109958]|uniref:tRNA threonylcarbamoyladenosine biosynthesis protein TsaB n=1 Tax=Bifidobacterium moraviense TaxID=2675323 RepID=A0A7Y0F0L2_9BIFI|nr:tRNA (adenosine(37)-N6)-threonylcarbamoyltransferase complex dimerization subunit type 1 TsaB [Bifidobacterium sp. DSM 109958]NMM99830.1 tRNA threonylcarbamoyladenosine biosynthesis protein TsaB [Bifidobacterium sp. DSM 109958]
MTAALVIDTSYGSTVGVVGHEPIVETDSRTHVEKLQVNIARAIAEAGLEPRDIGHIVVGVGPAPFTGLRAGIVTAKALAFATGAELTGQDVLAPQARWNAIRRSAIAEESASDAASEIALTLAVNDARRRQLYFALYGAPAAFDTLIAMDIDYPASIAQRVNAAVAQVHAAHPGAAVTVDVVGHGARRYADAWQDLDALGDVVDESVLDQGEAGLKLFYAQAALRHRAAHEAGEAPAPVEPLYLRRPDAEVPAPLKHVLGHDGAERKD